MKLFDRDYSSLTEQERDEWEAVKKKNTKQLGELTVSSGSILDYSKAARHYIHRFPNNYLDPADLADEQFIHRERDKFKELLDSECTGEREIINHINKTHVYFLIGSLFKKYYSFGHHEAFIFPEFQLGNSYKVDYLLVGKNSHGYHFVFIELEAPTGRITLENGNLGDIFRKGMSQVEYWKIWLEAHFSSISETFEKYLHQDKYLTEEFRELDSSRLNFAVLAGRRNDFTKVTYRKSRTILKENSTLLIHYDNVLDATTEITVEAN